MRKERRLAWILIIFLILFIPVLLLSLFVSNGFGLIFLDLTVLLVIMNVGKERLSERKLKTIFQVIFSSLIVILGIFKILKDAGIYDVFTRSGLIP